MVAATRLGPYSRGRPLSITLIAGFMMLGVLGSPLLFVFHLPAMFLGYFFTGPLALLIVLSFGVIHAAIAYGLWELRFWGRSLAIYYFNFAIFNVVISTILPGEQARYQAAIASMQSAMGTAPTPIRIPIWTDLVIGLPIIAIELWFVIASKKAFEASRDSPPIP